MPTQDALVPLQALAALHTPVLDHDLAVLSAAVFPLDQVCAYTLGHARTEAVNGVILHARTEAQAKTCNRW